MRPDFDRVGFNQRFNVSVTGLDGSPKASARRTITVGKIF